MERENAWKKYSKKKDMKKVMDFAEDYRRFISENKTERECVSYFVARAKKEGYKDLEDIIKKNGKLKAGDKVYRINHNKALAMFIIGSEPVSEGMNILGAHIDSPRMDLKQNPLYEDTEMAMLDTHYYGGIKKYQWVTLPMALHGVITKKDGIRQNLFIYQSTNLIINIFRSIPFIILLIFLIPLTRAVVGTAINVKGAILPLVFGTVPFYSRQVEVALSGVEEGKIEAARSMGSGTCGIIFRVYLHEALPDLIRVTTVTAISLIGLTTMAGAVGAGGIGSFAINYGQNQNHPDIVNVCVIVLLAVTFVLQSLGNWLSKRTTNRSLFPIHRGR